MRMICTWVLVLMVSAISDAVVASMKTISNSDYVARMAAATATAWPLLAATARLKNETRFYADAQILVYDGVNAWLIDAKGYRAIDPQPVRALGLPSSYSQFDKLSWEGRPTVYMGLGSELPEEESTRMVVNPGAVPQIFLLATHEAFHFYGQEGWPLRVGSRAEHYPSRIAPRQYRHHLIRSLHAAIQGEPLALGKARYWYDRWNAAFPDEVRNIEPFDIMEGTADYIEVLAERLAVGDPAEPRAWSAAVTSRSPSASTLSIDSESYALGALAIYLLDRQADDEWKNIVRGATPVSRLLASVAAVVDEPDTAMNDRIAQDINLKNLALETTVGKVISQLKHPDTVRLLVPMAFVRGAIVMEGLYQSQGLAEDVYYRFSAQLSPTVGRIAFDLATVGVLTSKVCGEEDAFVVVPLPVEVFQGATPARLQINTEGKTLDVPFPVKGTGAENVWCVRA